MNKKSKIKVATVALMAPIALSSTLLINSCTVNDTVVEQLNKLKEVNLQILSLAQTKTTKAIIDDVKIVERTESGVVIRTYINKDKLFKYVQAPIIERNVEMNIKDVNSLTDPNINNGNPCLSITYTLSKGGYTSPENTILAIGNFRTEAEQDRIEVEEALLKIKLFNSSVSLEGSLVLPSKVNKLNIWNYVNSDLALLNSVSDPELRMEIDSIVANDAEGSLKIFYKIIKNSYASEVISTNPILGFKSTSEQDKGVVNDLINSNLNLIPTQAGREALASQVTTTNYKTYISGFVEQTGIETIVHAVRPSDNQGTLAISLSYRKGNQESIVKDFYVLGFKKQVDFNKEVVHQEYSNALSSNWTIKSAGREVLAATVNESNISDYINNVPTPQNGVEINYVTFTVDSDSSKLNIIFQFVKNNIKSEAIQKEVVGFKTVASQDQEDVVNASNGFNLSPTSLASNVRPNEVTLSNINQYVSGFPPSQSDNGVQSSVIDVKPKALTSENDTIIVYIKFTKNGASITKASEVRGFRQLTEQEIFDQEVEAINPVISPDGTNVTAYYVNRNNVDQYVTGWGNWKPNVLFQSMSFAPSEDETELVIQFYVKKGSFSKQITRTITGFMSKTAEATNNLVFLLNEYQKIDWTGSVNNTKKNEILTTYFALGSEQQKLSRVKTYFSVPDLPENKTRGVNIVMDVKYSKTNKSLSNTQLELNWIFNNKHTSEKPIKRTRVFNDFKNPYATIEKFVNVRQNERKFGNWGGSFGSIQAATWYNNKISWGWMNQWTWYQNSDNRWRENEKSLRVNSFKYYLGLPEFNKSNIVFDRFDDNPKKSWWSRNSFNGFTDPHTKITYSAYSGKGAISPVKYYFSSTIEGYDKRSFEITMLYEWSIQEGVPGYEGHANNTPQSERLPVYV